MLSDLKLLLSPEYPQFQPPACLVIPDWSLAYQLDIFILICFLKCTIPEATSIPCLHFSAKVMQQGFASLWFLCGWHFSRSIFSRVLYVDDVAPPFTFSKVFYVDDEAPPQPSPGCSMWMMKLPPPPSPGCSMWVTHLHLIQDAPCGWRSSPSPFSRVRHPSASPLLSLQVYQEFVCYFLHIPTPTLSLPNHCVDQVSF